MARLLALLGVIAMMVVVGCGGGDSGGSSGSSGGTGSSSSSSDQPGKGKPAVTIGTKDVTEEFVLGELYAQALRAKGYTVNVKSNIGPTEITDKAMTSGKIDAYPEYDGETVATVEGKNVLAKAPSDTVKLAKDFYAKRGQITS